MGMDSAKVANSSNRNLQSSIGHFPSNKVKSETRKIREFPSVHPKEAATFRAKIQKEAKRQKRLNIIMFALLFTFFLLFVLFLNS
jgi:hypothetical protein